MITKEVNQVFFVCLIIKWKAKNKVSGDFNFDELQHLVWLNERENIALGRQEINWKFIKIVGRTVYLDELFVCETISSTNSGVINYDSHILSWAIELSLRVILFSSLFHLKMRKKNEFCVLHQLKNGYEFLF